MPEIILIECSTQGHSSPFCLPARTLVSNFIYGSIHKANRSVIRRGSSITNFRNHSYKRGITTFRYKTTPMKFIKEAKNILFDLGQRDLSTPALMPSGPRALDASVERRASSIS